VVRSFRDFGACAPLCTGRCAREAAWLIVGGPIVGIATDRAAQRAQPCTGRSVTCDTEMTTSRRDSLCNAYRFAQNVERTLAIPETPV